MVCAPTVGGADGLHVDAVANVPKQLSRHPGWNQVIDAWQRLNIGESAISGMTRGLGTAVGGVNAVGDGERGCMAD